MDIKLPFLGDGIDSATVLSVMVKVGDSVQKEQIILELETDKAVAPIPSSDSGVVSEILVKEGDVVRTGMPVIRLSGGGSSAGAVSAKPAAAPAAAPVQPSVVQAPAPLAISHAPSQLVGMALSGGVVNPNPVASPSIRRFSARFGLDLTRIPGSGLSGRITDDDVKAYLYALQTASLVPASSSSVSVSSPAPVVDFSKWGSVSIKPVTSLRKKISEKMRETWTTVPHVTQFDTADITAVMALRKKHLPKFEKKNAKLTLTVFTIKALVEALKAFPQFNASFVESKGELVLKDYIHMGVAVDTESGLIVPVIRDVDKKSMLDISLELNLIAEKARQRKIGVDELQGGSFTLSNLGGLGVGAFTPIVNSPDVAIMGISKGTMTPVYDAKSGVFEPKLLMPVSLSYDHRVIDGGDGARFVRKFVESLENFNEGLLKG